MIKHIKCDIFESGAEIICHQVNCQGVMGSGVAKQVREKYPVVYERYKEACAEHTPTELLGIAQFIGTKILLNTPFYGVFNLFGQENFGYDGKCYTDYTALRKCFDNVITLLQPLLSIKTHITIAIPYLMSCHRGGGDWNVVQKIIEDVFIDDRIDVLICEYNGG